VSKQWKPGKKTVALEPAARPSRIRRDPVPAQKKVEPVSREREILGGVAGVVLFATAICAVIIGIAATIYIRAEDPAEASHFGQCYNAFGPNCVIDASTIRAGGETVRIAGIDTPSIQDAQCEAERTRGIDAAVRLANLLNSGKVSVGRASSDASGHEVRSVEAGDRNVGEAMIAMGIAHPSGEGAPGWCG
jgi:endonuclease YncB( thermonuclease family)